MINFPQSPELGDVYPPYEQSSLFGRRWQWVGNRWNLIVDEPTTFVGKTLYVNSESGNDSTAERGLLDKPFLTINAAKNEAEEGDFIIVFPGEYTDDEILKDNVSYYFFKGVELSGNAIHVPNDVTGLTSYIYGHAELTGFRTISIEGNDITLHIECGDIINLNNNGIGVRGWTASNLNLTLKCGNIQGFNRGISLAGGGMSGNININCKDILAPEQYHTCTFEGNLQGFVVADGNIYGPPSLPETYMSALHFTNPNSNLTIKFKKLIDIQRDIGFASHNFAVGAHRGTIKLYGDIECRGIPAIGNQWSGSHEVELRHYGNIICEEKEAIRLRFGGNYYFNGEYKTVDFENTISFNTLANPINIHLNGKVTCENEEETSNAINSEDSTEAVLKIREAFLDSDTYSIVGNEPLEVRVEGFLHYNSVIHENINLIDVNDKFPELLGDEGYVPKFDSDGKLTEQYEIESILTETLNKIPNSKAVYDALLNVQVGLKPKNPVHASTTESITLSGIQNIDEVVGAEDLRILVRHQADPEENGIYLMKTGSWERTSDADTWEKLVAAYVLVLEGTQYAGYSFYCNIEVGGSLDVDPIIFIVFNIPGELSFANIGTGIQIYTETGSGEHRFRTLVPHETPELIIDVSGNTVRFNIDLSSYLTEEIDPTVAQYIKDISESDIVNWTAAFNWGDHSEAGYIIEEVDPTVPSHVKSIAESDIYSWNLAYGWGNHATQGYITTETDPTVPLHVKDITETNIEEWNLVYGWGNHAVAGYLTSETDPTVPEYVKEITTINISNWSTAYTLSHSRLHDIDSEADHVMNEDGIIGRVAKSSGPPEILTAQQVRDYLDIDEGADSYNSWGLYKDSSQTHNINSEDVVQFIAGNNVDQIITNWNPLTQRYTVRVDVEDPMTDMIAEEPDAGITGNKVISMEKSKRLGLAISGNTTFILTDLQQDVSTTCVLTLEATNTSDILFQHKVNPNDSGEIPTILDSNKWHEGVVLDKITAGRKYTLYINTYKNNPNYIEISWVKVGEVPI